MFGVLVRVAMLAVRLWHCASTSDQTLPCYRHPVKVATYAFQRKTMSRAPRMAHYRARTTIKPTTKSNIKCLQCSIAAVPLAFLSSGHRFGPDAEEEQQVRRRCRTTTIKHQRYQLWHTADNNKVYWKLHCHLTAPTTDNHNNNTERRGNSPICFNHVHQTTTTTANEQR